MNTLDAYRAAQAAEAAPKGGAGFYLRSEDKKKKIYKAGAAKSSIETVRLLHNAQRMAEGGDPFYTQAFFHLREVRGNDGQAREYELYCPKLNDGGICPLCAKEQTHKEAGFARRDELKAQGILDPTQLKADTFAHSQFVEANKWAARKFTVVELVERSKQFEGKKFWFIKDHQKQQGVWDKLKPQLDAMVRSGLDVTDPQTGFDLELTVVDEPRFDGRGTFRAVSAMTFARVATQLAMTAEETAMLSSDATVWRQVKRPAEVRGYLNSAEFLAESAQNRMPIWDDKYQAAGAKYGGAWVVYPPGGQPFHALYENSPEALAARQNAGTVPVLEATTMGAQPQAYVAPQHQQSTSQAPAPQLAQYQQPQYQQAPPAQYQQAPAPQHQQVTQPQYQQTTQPQYQQAPVSQAPAPQAYTPPAAGPAAQPMQPTGGVQSYQNSADQDELPF